MENQMIADEINYDIETGMYNNFDKLKKRLEYIAHRLVLSSYVTNIELSDHEIKTLKENDYMK